MTRASSLMVSAAVLAVTFASAVAVTPGAQEPAPAAGWHTFDATWSATGQRQTLPTEGSRAAAIVQLSGAVVLSQDGGLSAGFRAEAIGFDDGRNTITGRAVWTDAHGDRVFSALSGEPIQTGRRIVGTFTGGTGRYAGVTGDYQLTWQYVVRDEGDRVQGRAVDLKGRFRLAEARR